MNRPFGIIKAFFLILLLSSFNSDKDVTFNFTVEVNELRNSEGTVQFALYNRSDAFPDEHFKKYLKVLTGKIINGSSSVTFQNLPEGKYAVNVSLHLPSAPRTTPCTKAPPAGGRAAAPSGLPRRSMAVRRGWQAGGAVRGRRMFAGFAGWPRPRTPKQNAVAVGWPACPLGQGRSSTQAGSGGRRLRHSRPGAVVTGELRAPRGRRGKGGRGAATIGAPGGGSAARPSPRWQAPGQGAALIPQGAGG